MSIQAWAASEPVVEEDDDDDNDEVDDGNAHDGALCVLINDNDRPAGRTENALATLAKLVRVMRIGRSRSIMIVRERPTTVGASVDVVRDGIVGLFGWFGLFGLLVCWIVLCA